MNASPDELPAAHPAPANDDQSLTQMLRRDLGILSERDMCAMLEVKNTTLRAWRADGTGPSFTRLGGQIFYRRDDVLGWIAKRLQPCASVSPLQAVG